MNLDEHVNQLEQFRLQVYWHFNKRADTVVEDLLYHFFNLSPIRNIEFPGFGFVAILADALRNLFGQLFNEVGYSYKSSFGGQGFCNAFPHTHCGTGHTGYLIFQTR